ncbi:MAG: BrnT family toxin [Pseudomonadota bacterium]
MAESDHDLEFQAPESFEWNDRKAELNFAKHDISFDDASGKFYGRLVVRRSDRNDEERWLAIGFSEERLIAVAFTRRGDVIRIISARRARKNEERDYRNAQMERSAQG